jgi:hypothetical protein
MPHGSIGIHSLHIVTKGRCFFALQSPTGRYQGHVDDSKQNTKLQRIIVSSPRERNINLQHF